MSNGVLRVPFPTVNFIFQLVGAFRLYDLDGDGSITRTEMLEIVKGIFLNYRHDTYNIMANESCVGVMWA